MNKEITLQKNEIKYLVNRRFNNLNELKNKIESIVGKHIDIADCPIEILNENEDYRIFWDNDDLGGTIWYALTRTKQIYITEMCFD